MRVFFLCAFLLAPTVSAAVEISVGGVLLHIPTPSGFSPVTPQMNNLFKMQQLFVPATNEAYVTFISEDRVSAALSGEIPDLDRRFTVQTSKSLVNVPVPAAEFTKLKNIMKSQNDEFMERIERDAPEIFKQITDNIEKSYGANLDLHFSQMVLLPVHHETDRTLSYSAFGNFSRNDAVGNPAPYVLAITTTLVHVKSKVLFLYTYAEQSGLEWSRDTSKQWAEAIVLANPSDIQSTVKELLPAAVTGMDWGKVGNEAIFGAFVGMLAGLIGWAIKRGKATN